MAHFEADAIISSVNEWLMRGGGGMASPSLSFWSPPPSPSPSPSSSLVLPSCLLSAVPSIFLTRIQWTDMYDTVLGLRSSMNWVSSDSSIQEHQSSREVTPSPPLFLLIFIFCNFSPLPSPLLLQDITSRRSMSFTAVGHAGRSRSCSRCATSLLSI